MPPSTRKASKGGPSKGGPSKGDQKSLKLDSEAIGIIQALTETLAVQRARAIDLFREWDDDSDGLISCAEFRRALPMLGVKVNVADVDALFKSFDVDGSGEISYEEMHKMLREKMIHYRGIDIDKTLKPGAMGKIIAEAKNKIALRGGVLTCDLSQIGQSLRGRDLEGADIVQALTEALAVQHGRVIDLFREWDDDSNGLISRFEFCRALPMLGVKVDIADADAVFKSFDVDSSGEISFEELQGKLRESLLSSKGIDINDTLKPGAMGKILSEAKNKIALRGGVLTEGMSTALGSAKLQTGDGAQPIPEQICNALATNMARVIDLFREWDDDS